MRKINKAVLSVASFSSLYVTKITGAFAQGDSFQQGLDAAKGNTSSSTVEQIAPNIVNTALFVAGAAAVIMIIYGGFLFIFSAGESDKASKGRETIQWAVVGLVVCLLAYAIVNFVLKSVFK